MSEAKGIAAWIKDEDADSEPVFLHEECLPFFQDSPAGDSGQWVWTDLRDFMRDLVGSMRPDICGDCGMREGVEPYRNQSGWLLCPECWKKARGEQVGPRQRDYQPPRGETPPSRINLDETVKRGEALQLKLTGQLPHIQQFVAALRIAFDVTDMGQGRGGKKEERASREYIIRAKGQPANAPRQQYVAFSGVSVLCNQQGCENSATGGMYGEDGRVRPLCTTHAVGELAATLGGDGVASVIAFTEIARIQLESEGKTRKTDKAGG